MLFSQIPVVISKAEYIELRHQARYWKAQHLRATREIVRLKQELQCQAAQIKDLQARLFDKKSEKGRPSKSEADSGRDSGCPRGHQRNAPGHGRTPCPSLPVREESLDIPVDAHKCPQCGLPLKRCEALDEISEIKEVEVRAYIRRVHRRSSVRSCQCPETSVIVTAPPPTRLLPRSPYGISFWVQVILAK